LATVKTVKKALAGQQSQLAEDAPNARRTLTGFILYTFSYQNNGAVLATGRAGDFTVSQFQVLSSKTF